MMTSLDGLKNWLYFSKIKYDIWESDYDNNIICVSIEGSDETVLFDKYSGYFIGFE